MLHTSGMTEFQDTHTRVTLSLANMRTTRHTSYAKRRYRTNKQCLDYFVGDQTPTSSRNPDINIVLQSSQPCNTTQIYSPYKQPSASMVSRYIAPSKSHQPKQNISATFSFHAQTSSSVRTTLATEIKLPSHPMFHQLLRGFP